MVTTPMPAASKLVGEDGILSMPVRIGGQSAATPTLATAATGTGAQTAADLGGYNGAIMLECVAVGTVAAQAVTFTVKGSYDGTNFYTVGYQQVDGQGTLTRAVAGFTQTPGNGTTRNVLQVLDPYRYYTINISANTLSGSGAGLTVNLYALPA